MLPLLKGLIALVWFVAAINAQAQTPVSTAGTMVIVPADGEVMHANDQAVATMMLEEQDKDKSVAASRLNQKMKQGTDIVKHEDPQARLKTRGYTTWPVYADEPQKPTGKPRLPIGWRVSQYLEVVTTNLTSLPKTVAAAQSVLALNGLSFSLSDNAARKLDDERIQVTYKALTERIAAVAKAMGRNPADAVIETIDFEGAGSRLPPNSGVAPKFSRMSVADAAPVAEPSFEPGETTLHMQLVGKVRFK